MAYRVGIDIGGTFTDFALLAEGDGRLFIHKQLTTPEDPAQSVLSGVPRLLEKASVSPGEIDAVVHGTTLVTNAVIERRGAKTAMLVTAGFGDMLDIARERRYDMYDLTITYPAPLVPRALRREIDERMGPDGVPRTPIEREDIIAALQDLVDQGVGAVAVCFLNSPANPAHERTVAEIAATQFPQLFVSTSTDVFPFLREYERWTTATMNAFTGPLFDQYLGRLEEGLRKTGLKGDLFIMSSSGGTVTPDVARRFPVRMLESGPAAGVLQTATLGRQLKRPNLLSFDMGGTTAKGALVRNDQPLKRYEMEVARVHEFRAGSGLPAKIPVIDLIEIGSGGGSIAAVDARGTIAVGPHSAGAVPGPACYGQGGEDPTLTDANLTLGYLDDAFFLGGEMRLDTKAAERAIDHKLGAPLSVETLRAAWGVHTSPVLSAITPRSAGSTIVPARWLHLAALARPTPAASPESFAFPPSCSRLVPGSCPQSVCSPVRCPLKPSAPNASIWRCSTATASAGASTPWSTRQKLSSGAPPNRANAPSFADASTCAIAGRATKSKSISQKAAA